MKIVASRNINNRTTLLKYSSDNDIFCNSMSYSIPSDRADEFVSKYNKQTSALSKCCAFTTIASAIAGWFCSSKKSKIIKPILNSSLSALGGFILSAYLAYNLNNKLMDEYNVQEFIA